MDEQGLDIAAMSFEQALKALEEVVRKLEAGEVPLDESIDLYERGEKLRQHCQKRLDAAQARIETIVAGPDGRPTATRPFDGGPFDSGPFDPGPSMPSEADQPRRRGKPQ